MLYGHIEQIFSHIYAKTQLTATHTSYVIAEIMPETNMSMKLGI